MSSTADISPNTGLTVEEASHELFRVGPEVSDLEGT